MSLLEAIILGIIQGITEFIPVSSSGHLAIAESLLHIEMDTGILFDVMLHCGTLIAIFMAFRSDIIRMVVELIHIVRDIGHNLHSYIYDKIHDTENRKYKKLLYNNYRSLAVYLMISTACTAIVGYILKPMAEAYAKSLLAVGLGFLITAVVLLVVDYWDYGTRIPKDITWVQAVVLGICQGFGVFPGVSSLGITLTCGLLLGFKKNFAIKYALLLSIPSTIGAMLMEAGNFSSVSMTVSLGAIYIVGMIVAAVVGYFCIRYIVKFVQKRGFRIFSAYSLLLGIAAIGCYFRFVN